MTTLPDPSASDLQFDTAVPNAPGGLSLHSSSGVTCARCRSTLTAEYYDINSVSVCEECRVALEEIAAPLRAWPPFVRAALFGIGAAIVGAILYYGVIAIANLEIGIVAIAIGYMVGYAIRRATGGRGGRRLQILALVLTYWSVGLAYTPLAFRELAKTEQSAASPSKGTTGAPESGPSGSQLIVALAMVAALTFVLPVLIVFGSFPSGLISAAIIGFGMRQAWRMTAAPTLIVSGPYRIGAPPATPAVSS
jgi:hypothetical protein